MAVSEFQGKSAEDLNDMIVSYKKELFNLRFQLAAGEAGNTARFKEVRRNVARAKTALSVLKNDKKAA